MTDSDGFAKPWLEFEKQIGKRLLLHGPIDTVDDDFMANGTLLASKLTFPTPDLSIKTEDKEIAPGLKARIYTPPNYGGDKPVCIFYHGGGWAMGDLEGEDIPCRKFSKDVGVVIVSIDYRLAPKHPYPAGLDDAITGYKWALENYEYLKTKSNQAIIWGTSAGANIALSAGLKIIDEGLGSTLKGVVAVVPVTVARECVPEKWKAQYTSYDEHAEHSINTSKVMKVFFDAYGGDGGDPYISPLLHQKLKELRRIYIAVAGQDTLRDDGRLLKIALDEAGVPNLYDEYTGYPHWFWAYPSDHLAPVTAEYEKNLVKGFEFVLSE